MENVIKITGISRGEIYSPNHTDNDGLIFQLTVNKLRTLGAIVEIMDEKTFLKTNTTDSVFFSMARDPQSVKKLIKLEETGAFIINSGHAIDNCYRANLTRILLENHIAYPKSIILKTNDTIWEALTVFSNYPLWIKRGDVHAIHKEDVVLVYNFAEAKNVLHEFQKRGIEEAVLMEHIEGDIVKFYAVRETGFFHWFNLLDTSHSKFNIEKDVNSNHHTSFDLNDLKTLAATSASLLDVYIYGGDVIVKKDGRLCLIDLNDWPSFAPIREVASKHIAQLIFNQAVNFVNEGKMTLVNQKQFE